MTPRTGLVVEVRFEMDGNLVEAFLPPLVPSDLARPGAEPTGVYWYIHINQDRAFRGPLYGIYLLGQEAAAEAEVRKFLESHPAPMPARGST